MVSESHTRTEEKLVFSDAACNTTSIYTDQVSHCNNSLTLVIDDPCGQLKAHGSSM